MRKPFRSDGVRKHGFHTPSIWVRVSQPFTAPAVRPARIRHWKISVSMMSGTVTTTVAAIIGPQGISNPPVVCGWKAKIATGTVRWSGVCVNDSANRNPFQAAINASKPVVTRPGIASGTKPYRTSALAWPHPHMPLLPDHAAWL